MTDRRRRRCDRRQGLVACNELRERPGPPPASLAPPRQPRPTGQLVGLPTPRWPLARTHFALRTASGADQAPSITGPSQAVLPSRAETVTRPTYAMEMPPS